MPFYQRPFVLITFSFLAGLILAFAFRDKPVLVLLAAVSFIVLAFVLFVFRAKGWVFLLLSCLSFCAVGSLLMLERLPVFKQDAFARLYQPGDVCIVRICESKAGKGDWNKAIGELKQHIGEKVNALNSEKVLLLIHKDEILAQVGDQIAISSELMTIRNEGNPGEFNAEMFWNRQGIRRMAFVARGELLQLDQVPPSIITKCLDASRNYLKSALTAHLSGAELAISLALILGDNSMLDKEIRDSFTNTGALHVLAGKGDWNKAIGELKQHIGEKVNALNSEKVLLLIHKDEILAQVGDQIAISSELMTIRNEGNPGEFNAEMFWNRQGIRRMAFVARGELLQLDQVPPSIITKCLDASRNYLKSALTAHLSGAELAISLALILGDNSMLDKEIRDSFTNTGALHVLAVSGLHISIIMEILVVVLALFSGVFSRKVAVILLIGIMWWYAAITGLSPSVLRAVVMFTVLSIAQLWGKNYDPLNTLLFTAFILVLWNPLTVFDIGFQMSFLAMLGIFLFYEKIESFWNVQQSVLRKVWQGTAIGLAAQVMTTPLSLHYYNQLPNYFILTNTGLMASSGLILGGGLLIFSVSWWGFVAKWVGVGLMLVVGVSLWFIQWVEALPGAVAFGFTPGIWTVLALGILLPLLFYFKVGTKGFWTTTLLGIGILMGLVFQRFQNINKNEIIVFNAKKLVMAVRIDGHVLCFYQSRKDDFFKVERLLMNYLKIHSGKVHYCNLNQYNWNINLHGIKIEAKRETGSVRLTCAHHQVRVVMDDKQLTKQPEEHLIAMPWIKAKPRSKIEYYLSKGSWRIAL